MYDGAPSPSRVGGFGSCRKLADLPSTRGEHIHCSITVGIDFIQVCVYFYVFKQRILFSIFKQLSDHSLPTLNF